jgi:ATP-binding cassette subfamily F protein 3
MLNISQVSKIQGGELLYSKVTFQIYPGEKVGLVGPNGAGKTTLFRMIVGEDKPDEGQISLAENCRLSYFSQSVGDMKGRSALEEVMSGDGKIHELQHQLHHYEKLLEQSHELSEEKLDQILTKMGEVQTEFEQRGGYDLESKAMEILTGLGISPQDHQKPVEDFSGGWKMRIALAKTLVTRPDLILMDEPTNYLDLETILWLEEWLKQFKGAILMTTHDRDFMNHVVKKTLELSQGTLTIYSGNYDFYLKEKQIRLQQIKAEHQRQQDMLAKEEEFIAKFQARASHAAQVQSRVKKLEKIERVELPPEEEKIDFTFSVPPRSGEEVVSFQELCKSWKKSSGEDHLVFQDLTATVKRLEKIAVVGVNGAGKSTLLKVICGLTDPSSGIVKLGPSTRLGYFGQHAMDQLDPEKTVFEEVRKELQEASDGFLRNLLAAFLFRGDDIKKKVKYLSGGEKSRLILAILLTQKNNFLILDEPTNHLDIASREVLLAALKAYEGTFMLVSHDRHFLQALTTKVFEVHQGVIHIYPGTYGEYLDKKRSAHLQR